MTVFTVLHIFSSVCCHFLCRSSICEEIVCCRGDNVRLAVRVRVFVYPENACAVWLMFACKYRSVLWPKHKAQVKNYTDTDNSFYLPKDLSGLFPTEFCIFYITIRIPEHTVTRWFFFSCLPLGLFLVYHVSFQKHHDPNFIAVCSETGTWYLCCFECHKTAANITTKQSGWINRTAAKRRNTYSEYIHVNRQFCAWWF